MVDYIHDARRQRNHYEIRKHKNSKNEKEFYRIKRKAHLSSRSSAQSSMKNTLVTPYIYIRLDGDRTGELNNELKPVFLSKEDNLIFQLHDLTKAGNINEIEPLLLYSIPSVLEWSRLDLYIFERCLKSISFTNLVMLFVVIDNSIVLMNIVKMDLEERLYSLLVFMVI
jgi:hypothetical protein